MSLQTSLVSWFITFYLANKNSNTDYLEIQSEMKGVREGMDSVLTEDGVRVSERRRQKGRSVSGQWERGGFEFRHSVVHSISSKPLRTSRGHVY